MIKRRDAATVLFTTILLLVWPKTTFSQDQAASCPHPCICDYYAEVHILNCNNQELKKLPDGIPEWTTDIRFDGNLFSTLNLRNLTGKQYLEKINAKYNNLKTLELADVGTGARTYDPCSNVIDIYPRLKHINFRGNQFKRLPKCLLYAWPVLQELHLDYNQISTISELNMFGAVKYQQSLKVFTLKENNIRSLPKHTLFTPSNGLRGLHTFDVSHNQISGLQTTALYFMDELRQISLNDNRIRLLPDYAFLTKGGKVRSINLSNNEIDTIRKKAFGGLKNLQELDLSNNYIICLSPDTLSSCRPGIMGLSTSLPEFLYPNSTRLETDVSALRLLSVRGNQWFCDCDLKPFYEDEFISKIVSIKYEMCIIPDETTVQSAMVGLDCSLWD